MIYYWDGIVGKTPELLEYLLREYPVIIQALRNGNTKEVGLDLKKLPRYKLYTVRANREDRLLFTTIKKNGRLYLLFLDEIKNHRYASCSFLNPNVLTAFLERFTLENSPEAISEESFVNFDEPLSLIDEGVGSKSMAFFGGGFIQLNDEQESATKLSLPVIVRGVPGGGKACLALSALSNRVARLALVGEKATLLYVTESSRLVNFMQREWQQHPNAQEINGIHVEFKTYEMLLLKHAPIIEKSTLVAKTEFQEWLSGYIKKFNKKNNHSESSFLTKTAEIYQEFRIICGHSKDNYRNLGHRQSIFHDKEKKEWLLTAYSDYQFFLAQNKQVNPAFYAFEAHPSYDLITVDETQNFSSLQLDLFCKLAGGKVAFFMGKHQSLKDCVSKKDILKQLIPKINCVELSVCYRCPTKVIELARRVLALESFITGGIRDKEESLSIEQDPTNINEVGNILWLDPSLKEDLEVIQALYSQHSDIVMAIITPKQHKETAKKFFRTSLVFSTEEIGEIMGLQFYMVVFFHYFDDPLFAEINKMLPDDFVLEDYIGKPVHRPKHLNEEERERFRLVLNQLFTVLTRATQAVVFCEQDLYKLKKFKRCLQGDSSAKGIQQLAALPAQPQATQEDWLETCKNLLRNDLIEQAKTIFIEKKLGNEQTFYAFYNKLSGKVPNSVSSVAEKHDIKKTVTLKKEKSFNNAAIHPVPVMADSNKLAQKQAYIKNLFLRDYTTNNLKHLFQHKLFSDLMFEVTFKGDGNVDSGHVLFTAIMNDKNKAAILYESIKDNTVLQDKLITDTLCSAFAVSTKLLVSTYPLHWFLANSPGRLLLKEVIKRKPALITGEALCLVQSHYLYNSTLDYITSSAEGREILALVLINAPELAQNITADALYLPLTAKANKLENYTPFTWLTSDAKGLGILNILFKYHPDLKLKITAKTLCLPILHGVHTHYCPMYWLAATQDGSDMLEDLLVMNPNIIQDTDSIAQALTLLIRPSQTKNDSFFYCSTFYSLASNAKGRQILLEILKKNPQIAEKIKPKVLYFYSGYQKPSACFWLASCNDGLEILQLLFQCNPQLMILNDEKLMPAMPKDSPFAYHCVLTLLTRTSIGRDILLSMLKKNSNLSSDVTLFDLFGYKQHPEQKENGLPVLNLLYTEDGRQVLYLLFTTNNNLFLQTFFLYSRAFSETWDAQSEKTESSEEVINRRFNQDGDTVFMLIQALREDLYVHNIAKLYRNKISQKIEGHIIASNNEHHGFFAPKKILNNKNEIDQEKQTGENKIIKSETTHDDHKMSLM